MISKHKLIALVVGGVAAAAAVTIVLVTTLSGPSKPNSRYGDPALDALVAAPEQLYSPSNPLESPQDAAKRIEPLITQDLFQKMSVPPERQSNYKMGLVAEQHGTVTAKAYIDDHGFRDSDDTKTSVSRTVIVIQQISFPDGRKFEDKFGLLVDAVLDNGKWKAKSLGPEPTLDVLNKPAAPPPLTSSTETPPTSEPTTGAPTEPPTGGPSTSGPPTSGPPPTGGPSESPTVTITNTTTIPSTVTSTIPSPTVTSTVTSTIFSTATVPSTATVTGPGTVATQTLPDRPASKPIPGGLTPPPDSGTFTQPK